MQLFRPCDKRALAVASADLPPQLEDWAEDLGDEEVSVVFYTAPAAVLRDRLELLGYTLDTARAAFARSVSEAAADCAEWSLRAHGDVFKDRAALLEQLDVDRWL